MTIPTPSPSEKSYAERIAWMQEPVHLRCPLLPWFVLRWMEAELHQFFSHLGLMLVELVELNRQGKLQPWPEVAKPARRKVVYQRKSAPVVPAHSAGCSAVPGMSEPAMAADARAADAKPERALAAITVSPAGAMRPACLEFAITALGEMWQVLRLCGSGMRPPDRCRRSSFFQPAKAGWENCVQIVPIN